MNKNKTSFIPERLDKPVYKKPGVGMVSMVLGLLFVSSLVVLGGTYFYKGNLQSEIEELSESLSKRESTFESASISKLKSISSKIEVAESLIEGHNTLIGVFDFIEKETLKSVRFHSFNYKDGQNITLSGETDGYGLLALQAKVFKESKYVDDLKISDIKLQKEGFIGFSFELELNQTLFDYQLLSSQ